MHRVVNEQSEHRRSCLKQPPLPIEDCLEHLRQSLCVRDEVLLEAPPGAGKTTIVPLALLDEPWLAGRRILMLEPRRIATRSAAYRMASLLGESPGETVGYRMRLESKTSRHTRIEVITEGILTRMLQRDPALEGVGLVIFDEFHERNLDSDLALALCLQGRTLFGGDAGDNQNPLKILVMSATLDSDALSTVLAHAPVVKSEGRAYPVDIIYGRARQARERIVDRVVATIRQALDENPQSSVLAFLPGQGEIQRCSDALAEWILDRKIRGVHLRPLFGHLSMDEQQRAIEPLSGKDAGDQKVVLATNIAETSLTIEGVDVVVDSGLAREARFDPSTGMTGLHTVRISNASSLQRAGRAGRTGPGKCYRLWSAAQQQQLSAHGMPEILSADLAPLALQLLQWGVDDPAELTWLDAPPRGPWQQAIDLLESLGAIERKSGGCIMSAHGTAMSALPVHPRLAHLLLCGAASGCGRPAALLASLLSDRDPMSREGPDIGQRLDILTGEGRCPSRYQGWAARTRQLAGQFEQQLTRLKASRYGPGFLTTVEQMPGYLLACAYPDRIARRRHSGGYQLANGRSANLAGEHHLGKNRWLAVAEVSAMVGGKGDVIRSAAALDESLFSSALQELVCDETIAQWDKQSSRFIAEEQQRVGVLVLRRKPLDNVPAAAKRAALIEYLRDQDLGPLPWNYEHRQWCARVCLLRSVAGEHGWPDVSQPALLATLEDWLGPYLDNVKLLQDFKKLDLSAILHALLPWEQQQRLRQLAPPRLQVPSGSSIAIDYTQSPPVLAVKLQEMFGCDQTPAVAGGQVALLVHLLSPAGRPLQITQDLAGFWRSSYHDVKKEMKGRYPKHPWPDDPLVAIPTRKTRGRH
ncbi:MAG: ATP-dependent helicase HrpB [Gammaproteobacteria bacterium]|nr:ATP-dependent helicase HrpB [Gammaproteobacteria bacterium]